jgi:hypothetical protein
MPAAQGFRSGGVQSALEPIKILGGPSRWLRRRLDFFVIFLVPREEDYDGDFGSNLGVGIRSTRTSDTPYVRFKNFLERLASACMVCR